MKELNHVYKTLDRYIDEIYVVSERMRKIEEKRDPHGLPDLQKLIPECDRFEELRLKTKVLLEQYFSLEKECSIPINISYRRFYKELK
jgi:hypothetical protein